MWYETCLKQARQDLCTTGYKEMKRITSPLLRGALASVLAASTLAFAQDSAVPPSPVAGDTGQQNTNGDNGGWKRVGDQSQVYNPPTADPNGQNSYPNNNQPQNYPPQNYPPQGGQPQGNQAQQGAAQPNYPPPPPVPSQLTIPAGTYVTVRVNQTLSSDKNQPGDAFTASLVQPLVVNGVVAAEPGQTVGGRVVTAEKHHYDKPARLGLALTNLTLVDGQQLPINTQFISRQGGTTPGGAEVGTVAATTGVGAVIGAAAGWGTGAAIGAGAGAAAGLIGVLVTHNHASVIYPEQVLTFKIETPVTFSTANSSQVFRYVQPNEYDRPTYNNGPGNGMYDSAAPPPPAYAYGYPYYGAWGWGYPYYWGPTFGFYGGYWWGGRWYPHGGYWGGRYYGPRGFVGGYRGPVGGFHGAVGGGFHGGGGGFHGGGGHR
jgi:hypothetical protein